MTTLERNIQASVADADDIRWVRGYLQGLIDSGESPDELEQILRAVYERARKAGRDEAADLVLDGLDFLTKWHGPGMGVRVRDAAAS